MKCSDYTNLNRGLKILNSMGALFKDCPEGPGTSLVGFGNSYGPFWDLRELELHEDPQQNLFEESPIKDPIEVIAPDRIESGGGLKIED